jgi:hypothetical protein
LKQNIFPKLYKKGSLSYFSRQQSSNPAFMSKIIMMEINCLILTRKSHIKKNLKRI